MIHLFFNALAASAGAGLTYVRNIVPEIAQRKDLRATIALAPALRREFEDRPNVSFTELEASGTAVRFWREQSALPRLLRQSGADVLISTGNFALRKSPIPQVLLSGNSLYTSSDFYRDLRARHDYRAWMDTRIKGALARRSVAWADVTVAPSQAFADVLGKWTGRNVESVYHGFNQQAFFQDTSSLPLDVQQKISAASDALKLLFVSHYNYYRNFETLLRALPLIKRRSQVRNVRLFLTCKLSPDQNPGSYRVESAAALVRQLGLSEEVVQLGAIPYGQLHQLYRCSDIYVTTAYAETFAHPLVEAMASGLPIVASDLAVHREICGKGAVFFARFSPHELADQIFRVVSSRELSEELRRQGKLRSEHFSWGEHLDQIVELAKRLCVRIS
jgi:glycosyltransferase involved in cell wall biosynthesis